MDTISGASYQQNLIPFDRTNNDPDHRIRVIGTGSIGGKANGLVFLNNLLLSSNLISDIPQIMVEVPSLIVICTDVFDAFLKENDLFDIAYSNRTDDQIANAFQNAELPFNILGDLQALIGQVYSPLAIRSSSLLEDATFEPFAG